MIYVIFLWINLHFDCFIVSSRQNELSKKMLPTLWTLLITKYFIPAEIYVRTEKAWKRHVIQKLWIKYPWKLEVMSMKLQELADVVLKEIIRQWFWKRKKRCHRINKVLPTAVPTTKHKRNKRTLKDKKKRCNWTHEVESESERMSQ